MGMSTTPVQASCSEVVDRHIMDSTIFSVLLFDNRFVAGASSCCLFYFFFSFSVVFYFLVTVVAVWVYVAVILGFCFLRKRYTNWFDRRWR